MCNYKIYVGLSFSNAYRHMTVSENGGDKPKNHTLMCDFK